MRTETKSTFSVIRWTLCSLRIKNMIMLIIVFLIMMSVFLSILLSVILSSFNVAEHNETIDTSKRVTRAVTDDYSSQAALLLTYSNWV
jgi:sensor domain CHASE-containing protein